jgi:hypothetical protein
MELYVPHPLRHWEMLQRKILGELGNEITKEEYGSEPAGESSDWMQLVEVTHQLYLQWEGTVGSEAGT